MSVDDKYSDLSRNTFLKKGHGDTLGTATLDALQLVLQDQIQRVSIRFPDIAPTVRQWKQYIDQERRECKEPGLTKTWEYGFILWSLLDDHGKHFFKSFHSHTASTPRSIQYETFSNPYVHVDPSCSWPTQVPEFSQYQEPQKLDFILHDISVMDSEVSSLDPVSVPTTFTPRKVFGVKLRSSVQSIGTESEHDYSESDVIANIFVASLRRDPKERILVNAPRNVPVDSLLKRVVGVYRGNRTTGSGDMHFVRLFSDSQVRAHYAVNDRELAGPCHIDKLRLTRAQQNPHAYRDFPQNHREMVQQGFIEDEGKAKA